ncbi:hypothetical protein EK599_13735 [Vibrio sp. T187]|uniref:hypothetical protein n=1 Tax=Vibrio TaxID=662 RepID=UPI0010C98E58|nr:MULTISPECIES: hypothetical protein [Vibrio]MBW3696755.1 hypothetical protein [Vibrio sp. T187]
MKETYIGVDAGSTFCKVVVLDDGNYEYRKWSSLDLEAVSNYINKFVFARIALTGGGARNLSEMLSHECLLVPESSAWGIGSLELAALSGSCVKQPYIVASLGSGVLIVKVEDDVSQRIGGSSFGGSTLSALISLSTGVDEYSEYCEIANEGNRENIDLFVSDVYPQGGFEVPGKITAQSLGKIVPNKRTAKPSDADVIASLLTMFSENVSTLCTALAQNHGVNTICFGGSILKNNSYLCSEIKKNMFLNGKQAVFFENSDYIGAIGSLKSL